MIGIYCHHVHKTRGELCDDCGELLNYAGRRLDRCPFQESKTTCGNCKVHCYAPSMREKIKSVMRYAGPRMVYHHPVLAAFHFADGLRKQALARAGRKF
jgi:predicted amidophosphoribosyltransferase